MFGTVFVHPYTFIVKKWGIPVFLRYFNKKSCCTQMSMFVGLNINKFFHYFWGDTGKFCLQVSKTVILPRFTEVE